MAKGDSSRPSADNRKTAATEASKRSRTPRPANSTANTPSPNLLDYLTVPRLIVLFVIVQVGLLGFSFANRRLRTRNTAALMERALENKNWRLALWYFDHEIKKEPEWILPYIKSGKCLLELNRPDEAVKRFDAALERRQQMMGSQDTKSQLAAVCAMRAQALDELKRPSEAYASLQEAMQYDPYQPLANDMLLHYYLAHNDPVRASDHMTRLIGQPQYADELTSVGLQIRHQLAQVDPSQLADVPENANVSSEPPRTR